MSLRWKPSHPAFEALLAALLQEIDRVYVVGGVVRDYLLGVRHKVTDLDLAVEGEALPLARRAADRLGWAYYPLDEGRDVARLIFNTGRQEPLVCDIARLRGFDIDADLRSRDFTVNAMALEIERERSATLIDVCGGAGDLATRQLRRVSAWSLAEDPVRLLRAVRFTYQLDFALEDETRQQIMRAADTIRLASPERIRDELWKTLEARRPHAAVEELRRLGLLVHLLPELAATVGVAQSPPHFLDVYEHTLLAVERAAEIRDWIQAEGAAPEPAEGSWQAALAPWRPHLRQHFAHHLAGGRLRVGWLVWSALFHDIGKPATRTAEPQPNGTVRYRFFEHERVGATMTAARLADLRCSRHETALARAVVLAHMRPHHLHASFVERSLSRRAMFRYFRDGEGEGSDALVGVDTLLVALADYSAIFWEMPPPRWDDYLGLVGQLLAYAFDDKGAENARRHPLVNGHLLMAHLKIEPGPSVGDLLDRLIEAQVAGDVSTTEEALELATHWLRAEGP